ncbi:hypothetical protein AC578_3596 [Pseudocercospora eumusae]|uniref:1-phosphatidylinositol-3-phosphate 5-kinase n=1 Tax=Pseudocercospora eumusae TaxID=321146 RepID=A0A139HPR1_9PEZI|nr:hypothetical protein AC578_3596 [Pseudocercospora eumusae]
MAPPDTSSPATSNTFIPFLGARSRRGSLASIASRKEVGKDVLQQALDDIHTNECKSIGLTSFHDFDGEGGRGGAKELVSNGVTGLYNKLRQSVVGGGGGGSSAPAPAPASAPAPVRDSGSAKVIRPKSSESKESLDVVSQQSSSPATSRPDIRNLAIKKPAIDTQSAHTPSLPASPDPRTFQSNEPSEVKASTPKLHTADGQPIPSDEVRQRQAEGLKVMVPKDVPVHAPKPSRTAQHAPTKEDLDKARSAWMDNDRSEIATHALARVLSHHEVAVTDRPEHLKRLNMEDDEAIDDSDYADGVDDPLPPPTQILVNDIPRKATPAPPKEPQSLDRPPMLRAGVSHLPGFDPSRASSTMDGSKPDSRSSSMAPPPRKPTLEPSPNLNSALQRRRTGLKPMPSASSSLNISSITSLKRRVLAKDFWMKDENAKVCFSCGQSFSTFRRKHHCRTCGQIFDAKCTTLVPGRPFALPGTVRLCNPCEEIIFGDDDSTVFSDDDDYQRSPMLQNYDNSPAIPRFDGPAFSRVDAEVQTPSIGIPVSRRNREAKRRSAVIEFDAQPTHVLARPSSSHSLISLSRRPRSSSHHRRRHSRHQPTRLGRSSVDAERGPFHQQHGNDNLEKKSTLPTFHNDNVIDPDLAAFLSDDGSEDEEQPNILAAVSDGHAASPGDREKLGFSNLFTTAMRKGRSRGTDRRVAPSSVQDLKDEDKGTPRLKRNRNMSNSSMTFNRPSPRCSRSNLLLGTTESDGHHALPTSPIVTTESTHARVISSSSMQYDQPKDDLELYPASYEHVKKLLSQLLKDHNVSNPHAWQKALVPILMRCTNDVEPDVQQGDDMDIRHYIKLKKVPGGRPGDTAYVSGIVFSKNIALKTMARSISHPRILILGFAIEYARHESHFMSLEPVIAQEQEYLANIVGRIAKLNPHVVLVQKHISGRALHLLEERGITVAYNIKESVLAAVARVTETVMINSIDKLTIDASRLGYCENFEVKTYVAEGHRRTYIYLSGCEPDLGCTVVLRGGDTKTLRIIKRIAEFMCYVAYNLKLENYLLRDSFVSVPATAHSQIEAHDNPINGIANPDVKQETINQTLAKEIEGGSDHVFKYDEYEKKTRQRILSASPFVIFMQPYILTQLRDLERRLTTYKILRDTYAAADELGEDQPESNISEHFSLVRPDMVNAPASKDFPKAVREYLHAVHEAQLEKAEHMFETQERQWQSFLDGKLDPFDPFSHQKIMVLYSLVSSITSAPCCGPELLGIGFYASYQNTEPNHDEDITLGQYIEDLTYGASTTCHECAKKMFDHHRQYVHGYGQLSVSLSRQPAKMQGYDSIILMWSTCRLCRQETTVTQMSDHTWKYSFAKYLELSFWSSKLHPRAGLCKHDIHRDFVRCFGLKDIVIRLQYDPVDIYDVVVPRERVTWKVEADLTVKNEQYTHFEQRLEAFTNSIRRRLETINVDTLDEKTAAEAHELVDHLKSVAEQDHADLLQKLQVKYATSRYYELIPLNRALRFMDEKAIWWDGEFEKFEKNYFPSEGDIRKLAAQQLEQMFKSQPPAVSIAGSEVGSDTEDGTEISVRKKPGASRQATQDELLKEKAQDVMYSVVEEHKAAENEKLEPVTSNESELTLGPQLTRAQTPRKELEEVVEREDVKHLDLAIPSHASPSRAANPDEGLHSLPLADTADQEASDREEPFAIQPKPLSSGLLERIEAIRSTRAAGGSDTSDNESKIPRLSDLQKTDGQRRRDASPRPVAPPLLRATSSPGHPAHALRNGEEVSVDHSIDAVANDNSHLHPPGHDKPSLEHRISDRIGNMGRLATKVGKVAPSLIPRSIPFKDHGEGNKLSSHVSALAKHFDQMSREFEEARKKERRQRDMRSRHNRANPLASSMPVVEIYSNAADAVGEKKQEERLDQRARSRVEEEAARNQPEDLALVDSDQKSFASGTNPPIDEESGAAPGADSVPGEVTDATDAEASDTDHERAPGRKRDVSDPNSGSVTSSHDLLELGSELTIPEHRKNVWFKYLAEFWSKRSASGWANLEYPLHPTEHVFEDSDIIVREDEPSSVIALSLACADYRAKEAQFRTKPSRQPFSKHSHGHEHMRYKHGHQHTASHSSTGPLTEEEILTTDIEANLLSDTGTHMKYSFAHGAVKANCKIFYAESFDALRRKCGVADRFMESMSRCLKFDSKGGKTKSLFLRTLDNRFIIKSLQEVELKAFTKFAPDYFNFMSYTLFHGVPSVIAKMFGLFQVNIRNPATGVDFSYYLLVMENLFYERNPNRRFDLKGSMRNRKIESTGQADEVLLDENLVETIFESPLFVREHSRKLLQASVFNDTLWLCKQNVMDYSLMAGFDDARKELVVGIIDCIRTYTWDKKLESWIKDRGKNKPTITSPKDYRNRFRVSMMQYVLQAPNCWHQFQAQLGMPKMLAEESGSTTAATGSGTLGGKDGEENGENANVS